MTEPVKPISNASAPKTTPAQPAKNNEVTIGGVKFKKDQIEAWLAQGGPEKSRKNFNKE